MEREQELGLVTAREFVEPVADTTVRLTKRMVQVHKSHGREGESFGQMLRRLYIDNGKSQKEIGSIFGVSSTTVQRWVCGFIPAEEVRSRHVAAAALAVKQSWQNPEIRAARLKGLRAVWNDPIKRD